MGITLYIVVSTNRSRFQFLDPNVSLNCSAVSLQRVSTKTYTWALQVFFTTENRQPDMVANKIKCTTSPVGFHGHIWHQSLTSRVSSAIFVHRIPLITPLHSTAKQASPSMLFLGGHLLDMRLLLSEGKKIASGSNTTGGLSSVYEQQKGKTCKWAFFSGKKGENYVDFGVSIVSLHHTSEGSSDFYWAYGWHFDFDSALLTLMLTPAIFLQKRLWHIGVVCAICTVFPSHYLTLCPKGPLKVWGIE